MNLLFKKGVPLRKYRQMHVISKISYKVNVINKNKKDKLHT